MRSVFTLLVAGVVAGLSYTQTASAQYPGFAPIPQPSVNYYPYNSPAGYYRPHHGGHHHHGQVVIPNYTSMYGGNVGYAQQPVVVPTPNVYTTNNYYQAPRNHPWHLGHYLLGN